MGVEMLKNVLRTLLLGFVLQFAATGAVAGLTIQHWVTANGTRVYFVENHDLPLLDVSVEFAAGSGRDTPAKAGLASMTRHMLGLGAGGLSEDEISRRLADVGAVLGGSFDPDRAGLGVRTLSSERERGQALGLLAKMLQQPDFPAAALEREKARVIAAIKESETQPDSIADRAFYRAIYGSHPYALRASGEVDSASGLKPEDVQAFHRTHYTADGAVVAIIGDVSRAQAEAIVAQLTDGLPRAESPLPQLANVTMPASTETQRISHPATQTHILLGYPGMRRGDPDYFPLYVGNYILGGGGFVSRLTENVREKKGLAYSVYSYFVPLQQNGPFQIGLQTKKAQADEALEIVRATLRDFIAKGPTEKELEKAKQNIVGGFPLRLDSNKKILEYLSVIGFYRLPLTYLDDFTRNVEKVTVANIREAFARRIKPDGMATIMVGAPEASR